jgi:hypothetical protein
MEGKKIKEIYYLKLNIYLLLLIIPLSALGYYFSVHNESLFFLYEWLLVALIIASILFSIKNIVSIKNERKWVAISILAFLIQFSVLGLFLGPLSNKLMIYLFYVVAIISFVVFIISIRKNKILKIIPIVFMILTGIFTLYMIFINAMWGNGF